MPPGAQAGRATCRPLRSAGTTSGSDTPTPLSTATTSVGPGSASTTTVKPPRLTTTQTPPLAIARRAGCRCCRRRCRRRRRRARARPARLTRPRAARTERVPAAAQAPAAARARARAMSRRRWGRMACRRASGHSSLCCRFCSTGPTAPASSWSAPARSHPVSPGLTQSHPVRSAWGLGPLACCGLGVFRHLFRV